MKFTNKEEYLAYRSNWKSEYKKLSQTIRGLKYMAKEESRACNMARKMLPADTGTINGWYGKYFETIEQLLSENEQYQKIKLETNAESYNIKTYKEKATQMLEERKASKIEAQRQYLEAMKELITA